MKQIKTITAALLAVASVTLMSFSAAAVSGKLADAYNAAKINWEKESHDFGEIPQGKPVSVEFSFTNSGDEPLLITDITTSCGCTAPEYEKAPIVPGRSSKVKVTYNAIAMGAFTKTITVKFQEKGVEKLLSIKGTVK